LDDSREKTIDDNAAKHLDAGGGVLYVLQHGASVADAARLMEEHNVGIVAVLDGQKLVGVVSERDIVRRIATLSPRHWPR
jgi:predicted transcriptional regulator